MCQYSQTDLDGDTSNFAEAMALRDEQLSECRSAISSGHMLVTQTSSSLSFRAVYKPCTRGWWHNTLSSTSQEFTTHLPTLTAHLSSLQTAQKRMHRLARKRTQARLYPNPASANSKVALKAQLTALVSDMHFTAKAHETYSTELVVYLFPVQAVIDNQKISGRECHCSDCNPSEVSWTADMHPEIQIEAEELWSKIEDMRKVFKKVEVDFLEKWKKSGMQGLQGMIDALPDAVHLRTMTVVKRFFPRQVREMDAGVRPKVVVMRGDVVGKGKKEARVDLTADVKMISRDFSR